ncbi:MAG: MarR family transcriptional regulator [Ilumatobacteraceae bacterium]|nr:MarR family transcriptional regulator [Ilumatobacteraceae bacterium]
MSREIEDRKAALAQIDATLTAIGKLARSRRATELRQQRSGVHLGDATIAALAAVYRHGPMRMGEVADRIDLDASRASKEIRRLVIDGYVRQQTDPQERRASLLTVTAKGQRAFERYRAGADALVEQVFEPWDDDDLIDAARLLQRLAASFVGTTRVATAAGPAR